MLTISHGHKTVINHDITYHSHFLCPGLDNALLWFVVNACEIPSNSGHGDWRFSIDYCDFPRL